MRRIECVDHTEVFAWVTLYEIGPVLFAVAAHHGMPFQHMDITTTFLKDDELEVLFVKKPKGYDFPGSQHVCRVDKAFMA